MSNLVDATITAVREMTDEECSEMGWSDGSTALVFNDETVNFVSADDEGNGPGEFRGHGIDDLSTLEGESVKGVGPMSPAFQDMLAWEGDYEYPPACIVLADGERGVYPVADSEGNDRGFIRGYDVSNDEWEVFDYIFPTGQKD